MKKLPAFFFLMFTTAFFVLNGCKKDGKTVAPVTPSAPATAPSDPVDSITGVYKGNLHFYDISNWRALSGAWIDSVNADTTYISSVTIQKTGSDYFIIVSDINWYYMTSFFSNPIKYDSSFNGPYSVLRFVPSKDSIYVNVYYRTNINGDYFRTQTQTLAGKKQ